MSKVQRRNRSPGSGSTSPGFSDRVTQTRIKPIALAAALALGGGALPLYAAPEGGTVVGGSGSISQPDANTTNVQQNSHRLALQWNTFNVGVNESVNFYQPSSSAWVLNQILDGNASVIRGQINANGNVILVNGNGVYFSSTAQLSVGSLVASGLGLSTEGFMAGQLKFERQAGTSGRVINRGVIQAATGGSVSLLGASVENSGTIIANAGRIHLGVGERVTLDFDGDGLMRFAVDEALQQQIDGLDTAIRNTGELRAEGGQVVLEGRVARDVFAHVVNNEGVITAGRIDNQGGVIRLVGFGGSESSVLNSGTLDAAGRDATSTGGQVHVLGERIALTGNALVDASGAKGGGEILIGGDYQGKNPDIPNADKVVVTSGVQIKADATEQGDGGKVIVWADGDTRYFGSISARGGAAGGNGGFAEVSGKQRLAFAGSVDLSAPEGQRGSLLLDPDDLYISDEDPGIGDQITGSPFEANDGAENYWVDTQTLAAVSGNIDLLAGQNIIFLNSLNMAAQDAADTLTLNAGNAITMNGNGITTDGSVSMTAGAGGVTGIGASSVGVAFTINSGGAVNQSGAIETPSLTVTAVGGIVLNAANEVGSFDATNTGTGDILFTNTATTLTATVSQSGGGDVVINNTGALVLDEVMVSDGGSLTAEAGEINVNADITANAISFSADDQITVDGDLTAAAIVLTADNQITVEAGGSFNSTASLNAGAAGTIFDLTAGTGFNATITGNESTLKTSGRTLSLTGVDQGGSGTLGWEGVKNLQDVTGTVDLGTGGSVTGNVTVATLNYSAYTAAVTFDLANGPNQTTGIGGTWLGVTTVTGNATNGATNTIKGGEDYTVSAANAGGDGTVSWANFGTLEASDTVTFSPGGSVSGNVTAATVDLGDDGVVGGDVTATTLDFGVDGSVTGDVDAATLDYSGRTGAVAFDLTGAAGETTGIGGTWSNVTTVTGNGTNSTVEGTGSTYTLINGTPNAGGSGAVNWTNFHNISDATGTVNFQASGSVSGNVTAQTLDYSGWAADLTLNVTTGAITSAAASVDGVGGTLSGYSLVKANAARSNTVTGTGATYMLTSTANAGSSNGLAWTNFRNISDATGTVDLGTGGSVTGNVTAQTLDYSGYGAGVNFSASNVGGATTGIGGTWGNVATVVGSAGTDTVSGSGLSYDNFHATTKGTFEAAGIGLSGFENINDSGAATVDMSGTTTGGLSGNVTTAGGTVTLGGGNQVGGNVNMGGAGTLEMGTAGSVTGTVSTATLDYSDYATGVNFSASNVSGATTGIGGTWGNVATVVGSAGTDTVSGSGLSYDNFHATTKGTFEAAGIDVSGFENINDSGAATVDMSGTTTGGLSGNVTTAGGTVTLGGGNQVGGNVNMGGAGTLEMGTAGSVTGTVSTATLDYSDYATGVNFSASNVSGATTGIGGTWGNVATVVGSAGTDTVSGNGLNYDNFNATTKGTFEAAGIGVSGFENINDSGAATVDMSGTTMGGLSGNVTTAGGVVTLGGGNQVGGNVNMGGAGTLEMGTAGSVTGTVSTATLDYSAYTAAVTFDLANGANQTTGIGGTWLGVTTVTGNTTNGATNTIKGGEDYTVSAANAGGDGTVSWTNFGTLEASDTVTFSPGGSVSGNVTAATVDFGTNGTVGGNVTAQTLDYSGYGAGVNFSASNVGGETTGIGGTWSGVTSVVGSAGTDTVSGNGLNYDNFNATTKGTFEAAGIGVSGFENINDSGAATVDMSGTTTGGVSGNVSTAGGVVTLGGGNQVGGNVNMGGAGTLEMGTAGSVAGNVTVATLDYSAYTAAVTFDLANGANQTTGIGGTWTGVTTVTGSGVAGSTVKGGANYTVTGADEGDDGSVSWTAFDTLVASGVVSFDAGASVSGDVTAATVDFGTNGTVGGNVTAETLDYDSYDSDVMVTLSGANAGSATGITGTFSGVDTINGNATKSNTMGGTGQTYVLNNTTANSGSSNDVTWTGFRNISDTTGTVDLGTGGSVTGNVTAETLDYSDYATGVNFSASNVSGATTGIGGTWSSVATVVGSVGSDTVSGSALSYDNFHATTKGMFDAAGIGVSGFENINDSGAATVDMSGTTTGGVSGNVSTAGGLVTLGGGNQVGGNVNMGGTGTLNLGTGGSVTGNVTAATLDYSAYTAAVTFDLANGANQTTGIGGTWSGITELIGSDGTTGANTTLKGSNAGATYTLTGINAGTAGALAFSGVGNITGGTGADTFTGSGGSLSGSLNDGGGNTTLNGTIQTTGVQTYQGAVTLGTDVTLVTSNNAITFSSTVNSESGEANNLTVNTGSATVSFGAAAGGGVGGDLGTLTISNTSTSGVILPAVTAAALSITTGGPITDAGALTISGNASFNAGAANITLDNANDFGGVVTITSADAVTLNDVNALTVVSTSTTGAASLTAGAGGLTVSGVFGDALTTTTTTGTGTTSFGVTSVGGALSVTSAGAVSQSGELVVDGTTAISAVGQTVTLDDASNDFKDVVTITSAGALTLNDVNALTVESTSTTGAANLTAGGDLVVSGAFTNNLTTTTTSGGTTSFGTTSAASLNVTSAGAVSQTVSTALTINGNASLNAGTADIVLNNTGNNFGSLTFTGGAVTIAENSNTVLTGVNTATSLNLTSNGTITDAVGTSLVVTGLATFNAGSNAITLGDDAGDTTNFGAVNLTGGAVTLTEDSAMTLAGLSATSATLTANGAISQSGAASVTGATSLTATASAITLSNTGNSFGGAVTATGTSVTIDGGTGSLDVGSGGITASTGNVDLRADGLITATTGTGKISAVNGIVILSASTAGENITLSELPDANHIDALTLQIGRSGETGQIRMDGDFSIGSNLTFEQAVQLTADVTLDTSASGGNNITFGSTIDGAHALTLDAGDGDILAEAAIGGSTPLSSLTIDRANTATLEGALTVGNIDITVNSLEVSGNLDTRASSTSFASDGDITLKVDSLLKIGGGSIGFYAGTKKVSLSPSTSTNTIHICNDGSGCAGSTAQTRYDLGSLDIEAVTIEFGNSSHGNDITLDGINFDYALNVLNGTGNILVTGALNGQALFLDPGAGIAKLQGGSITTQGNQTFNSNVQLNGDFVLTATNDGDISFNGDLTETTSSSLTIAQAEHVTLGGSVTLTGDFEVTQASGTLTLSDGLQLTASSILLNANKIIATDTTLDTSTSNGAVELVTNDLAFSEVDIKAGTGTITLAPKNATTDVSVCSSVLDSCDGLTADATHAVYNLGSTTNFRINPEATLQLGQGGHAGNISLYTISLAYDLALNTSGKINLMGDVTTAHALDLTAVAGIEVGGGGGVTRLFNINDGGVVNFNSVLNAATANTESLSIVTTGTGNAVFDQAVGGVKRLASFNVNGQIDNGGTALNINAGTINLSSATTLTSSAGMTFAGGLNAEDGSLLEGNVSFNAIELTGHVNSTGSQTYDGAVTLVGGTTLTAQAITFDTTVDSELGQHHALTLNGDADFQGLVGGTTALGSLSVTGTNTTTLGADVTTTGTQTYGGTVTLAGAGTRTLTAGSGQLIDMQGGLAGNGRSLNIATGNWKLTGNATGLNSLSVAGTSTLAGNGATTVNTTNGQTYAGMVTLAGTGTRTLSAGSGQLIHMQSGLTGAGLSLSIGAGNWRLTGDATGLNNLSVATGSRTTLAGNVPTTVTTTGAQTYGGEVNVEGSRTLNAGTTLTLQDAVTADADLTLIATNLHAVDTISATQNLTLTLQNNLTHDGSLALHAGTGALTVQVNQANNSAGVTLNLNGLDLSGSSILLAGSGRDTLQGYTSGSGTWEVTGNGSGSLTHAAIGTGANNAGFSGFATLVGGDDADTFTVTGNHTGSIRGQGGDDTLLLSGAGALGSFDGGSGSDTFDVSGASHPRTLVWGQDFSNVESLIGNGDVLQGSATAGTIWNLTGSNSGTINAGSLAEFSGFTQINSGTGGENIFTSNGQYGGTVRLAGANRWNFTSGARLTQGSVTGNGSLTIAQRDGQTGKSNFSISSSDLYLPNLAGFTGNLIIGGTLTPPSLPLGGGSTVVINANRLTVADALTTGGNLVLLGSDIELTGAAVTSGGSSSLIAGGSLCNGCAGLSGTGDLLVSAATTINASSGRVIAARGIQNASALTLRFNGGDFELAVAAGQEESSQPSSLSTARSISLSTNTQAFINSLNLQLVSVSVNFANPAAAILGVRAIEVIDLAVFEEDLTLFGRVGEGVALAFAQCEEVEGCTPNVTLEELDTVLGQIQLNIQQLEAELEQTRDPGRRKQIEALLTEHRSRQQEYTAYRTDLADFTGFEAQFEDEFGKAGANQIDMEAMEREVKVVETIYTRVRFLENLRFNQERRKVFAERTGLDLSDQRLSEIIDSTLKSATRAEARIERMLQGKNEAE